MNLYCLIVSYNSCSTLPKVLSVALDLLKPLEGKLLLWDNCSSDSTQTIVESFPGVRAQFSPTNVGFARGNNELLQVAVREGASHILLLNPDAVPKFGAIEKLAARLDASAEAVLGTPKILRANSELEPILPKVIDACGMIFTSSFRHLDRGAGELDLAQYTLEGFVPGGTGAALMIKASHLSQICYERSDGYLELFDERFFAYREDAELALRVLARGFRTIYVPGSIFYHVRSVTPERRASVSKNINRLSVQNRFLLQSLYLAESAPLTLKFVTFLRNLLVRVVVFIQERESIRGLADAERLIAETSNDYPAPKLDQSFYKKMLEH